MGGVKGFELTHMTSMGVPCVYVGVSCSDSPAVAEGVWCVVWSGQDCDLCTADLCVAQ